MSHLWLCLAVFLSSPNAHAVWSPQAIEFAHRKFSEAPASGPSAGFIATLWGGAYREYLMGGPIEGYKRPFVLPKYFKTPLYGHYSPSWIKHPDRTYSLRRGPLIVFLPGVFGETESISGKLTLRWFGQMGYHVIILPNPWSKAYQSAQPIARRGYPQDEGLAIRAATQYAIDHMLGRHNVTRVELVGESLGAFTAAVAYGLDAESPRPVFSGGGSFFWPPIAISSSIQVLDEEISTTREIYERECSSLLTSATFIFRLIRGLILFAPKPVDVNCAGPIVVQYSFQRNLAEAAKTILQYFPELESRLQPGWASTLDFSTFIERLAPQYLSSMNPALPDNYLNTWLRRAHARGRRDYRVFSSVDDFINAKQDWRKVSAAPQDRHLLLMPWGGHIGLTSSDDFPEFLARQFRP